MYSTVNIPDHVKLMSPRTQRQWIAVANLQLKAKATNEKAALTATAYVKHSKELELTPAELEALKDYQYVSSWEYEENKLDPASVGYNPLGATADKGCANCNWFISPSTCSVVAGEISPTGLSSMWLAEPAETTTPMLVQVVDDDDDDDTTGSISIGMLSGARETTKSSDPIERLLSGLKSIIRGEKRLRASAALPPVLSAEHPFSVTWTKDGRLRFFTAWSNNFVDREGEVFPEYAHKEFIEWADQNQQYPELWLWHTKGTKYGQVDWLDYTDGFVYASGLIDPGYEDLAVSLSKEDCGVSHGFHGFQRGNEIIQYRSFEISTLPRTNAAVWTTSFNVIGEGAKEMAFTQQKKDWLKAHGLDDAAIAAAETQATALSKSLKDLGVAYKDSDIVEDPAPVAAPPAPAASTEGDKAAATQFQTDMLAAINKQNEVLAALAGSVKSIDERVKAVERTDDEKIAAAVTGARAAGGVSGTKSDDNVVSTEQKSNDREFFDTAFLSGLGINGTATAA